MRSAACATAAALLATASAFTTLEEHSFAPPFRSFDAEGMRSLPEFRLGGHATLNEHFLRLTNDRQSKRASIWGARRLDRDEWSTTLRFRVSGQGKKLFGDGLALWYTTHDSYREGNLHAFTDTFSGFGIIFDTFVNTEPGHVHKDVQIVSSDGSAPVTLSAGNPIGCSADFRYWEGRDDYSVKNHSIARVRFAGNRVSVSIDAKATGNWVQCISDFVLPLQEGWQREGAWMGLTASTGDLADNHDVLSLITGPEDEVAPAPGGDTASSGRTEFISTGNSALDDSLRSAIAAEALDLDEHLAFIKHDLEHSLSSMDDSIKATLKKLLDADKETAKRIEELEKRLQKQVTRDVEGAVDNSLSGRLSRLESVLTEKMGVKVASEVLPQMAGTLAAAQRAWLIPFAILALAMVGLAGAGWRVWRQAKKTHLL